MTPMLVISALFSLTQPPPEPLVVPSRLRVPNATIGSCLGTDGRVDLRNLSFVNNSEMRLRGRSTAVRLRDESVVFVDLSNARGAIRVIDVDRMIDPDVDVDISLKLATYQGSAVVYWRETYVNRSHRQGVFRLDDDLTWICEGRGGVDRSH